MPKSSHYYINGFYAIMHSLHSCCRNKRKPTSSTGGLSSSLVASSSPLGPSALCWDMGEPLSSMVTIMGSMMERAVSSSAASEQENTSRLSRLQVRGRSLKAGRKERTAVLWKGIKKVRSM